MHRRQWFQPVDIDMDLKRIAPVETSLKEYGLPKIAHDRKMSFEIHLDDVDKDRPQNLFLEGAPVERHDQVLDVLTISDIPPLLLPAHACTPLPTNDRAFFLLNVPALLNPTG